MTRPNILWITTHDINPHLGAYEGTWPGAEYAVTPNLDRLAAEGALYENAFASAPVCAPSRSAIMTGCHPSAIGTLHMRTKAVPPPEVRLFTEYFREAGYYTTNNVFTDFQVQTPRTAFDDCSTEAHWRNRPTPETPFLAIFHSKITHESQIYLDDEDFAAATARVEDDERHNPDTAPLPPYYPDTAVFRQAWARYSDLVTQMDHWVGDLLRDLDDDGLTESTLVVFWSDHGLGMPRGKRWVHEAGLREPLLVRWPSVLAPGTRRTELVHLLDLAPTMLTACGLPVPEHMHGRPLLDGAGNHLAPNRYTFGARDRIDEQMDASSTVRDERYRYIRNAHPDRSPMQHSEYPDRMSTWREMRLLAFEEANQIARGERRSRFDDLQRSVVGPTKPAEELYDVQADPHETVNLSADPSRTADLDRLRAALDEWTAAYGAMSAIPEHELHETWRPGGRMQVTSAPQVVEVAGAFEATCETPGASIGWTTDPPRPVRPLTDLEEVIGAPEDDGRHWHLYHRPVRRDEAPRIWFRAWRLGFEPSSAVAVGGARNQA